MVLFYLPNLKAGGAQRVILNILKYLDREKKLRLILLLGEKEGVLINEIPYSVPVHYLDKSSGVLAIPSFISFCRQFKPKVIFTTLSVTASFSKPFLTGEVKVINRLGNTIGAEKEMIANAIRRYIYVKVNHAMGYLSDVTIFQCNYMKQDYISTTGFIPLGSRVIYNPVNTKHIEELANESLNTSFDYVAVGRLQKQKDYRTLLKACSLLKLKYKDFTLAILGEGEQKEDLEAYIQAQDLSENVFLIGHQSNPYKYMKTAKYLVSSSLYEGFSNVIVEALCLGTPVLATNCPGANAEVLTNGKNAYLCNVADPNDLASTLERGLKNHKLFNRDKIKKDAISKYDIEKIAASYIEVINSQLMV